MSDRLFDTLLIQAISIIPVQFILFWLFLKYMKVTENLLFRALTLTAISFLIVEILGFIFRGTGLDLIGIAIYVGAITYILRKKLVINVKQALTASIGIIVATYILGPIIALSILNNFANNA